MAENVDQNEQKDEPIQPVKQDGATVGFTKRMKKPQWLALLVLFVGLLVVGWFVFVANQPKQEPPQNQPTVAEILHADYEKRTAEQANAPKTPKEHLAKIKKEIQENINTSGNDLPPANLDPYIEGATIADDIGDVALAKDYAGKGLKILDKLGDDPDGYYTVIRDRLKGLTNE